MEVGLSPGHIVLDGTQLPQKGHSPQFSALVYCGQTVAHLRSSDLALRAYIATAETNKHIDQVETRSHFSTDLVVDHRSHVSNLCMYLL